jgi:hypothetical protein
MIRAGVCNAIFLGQTLASTLEHFVRQAVTRPDVLSIMSSKAAVLTEGNGSNLVINAMLQSGKI